MIHPKNPIGDRHVSGELVDVTERYAQNALIHFAMTTGYREFDDRGRPLHPWALLANVETNPVERAELKRRLEVLVNHQDLSVYNSGPATNCRAFYLANFGDDGSTRGGR